ncbi:hypothetical protein BGZ60DRAFT_414134 [Tricladium varicosporioides]|nr:hypothetical protein BGZ60DRAFT_414134 [Hymenoscyphus varicosporioides]
MPAITRRSAKRAAKCKHTTTRTPSPKPSDQKLEAMEAVKEEEGIQMAPESFKRKAMEKHAKLPSSERTSKSLQQPKKATKRANRKRESNDDGDYRPSSGKYFDCGLRRGYT